MKKNPFRHLFQDRDNKPKAEASAPNGTVEMKCHVAKTGSILDLVGDRVHGWDRSSSWLTKSGVMRIGCGAEMTLSWLSAVEVLPKGGGVLRRGTPVS